MGYKEKTSSVSVTVPAGSDDHVAFGLAVVANTLYIVDLGQLVDDLPVLSVHGREAVAPLWLFSLDKCSTQNQSGIFKKRSNKITC